jgi:uncharacterized protein (TIGR03083 family)
MRTIDRDKRRKNMPSPEETVQLVIAESEHLIQYLPTLPPEAWRTPSACGRWEVRDVVTHLAIQGQFYADMIARSLQGDASTPEGRPAAGSATAASFAESSAQRTITRREQLGDQILAEFITTNAQLNHRLASLGPQDWEKPHFFNSLGIAPLRLRPDLRLFELVLHGWDMRSRLEANVRLPAESLPVLLGLVRGPFTRWLFRPGPRLPVPIRYRFALPGAGAYDTDIIIAGDMASIEPAEAATATVTCRCDAETFVLIMTGRLLLPDARAQGRLVAEGEVERVDAFGQWFGGV